MPSDKIGSVIKAYCSTCRGQRNCEVAGHQVESGQEGGGQYMWRTDWYLLICRGCDHVFAQSVSTNSEDFEQDYGPDGEVETEYVETIRSWPAKSKRERPDWFTIGSIEADQPTVSLDQSLFELYGALDQDLMMLAAIGLRTSFDIAAELLGVDPDITFQAKLDDLLERKLIKEHDREHLDVLVNAGSASAHRGWKPTVEDLDALMDTLEAFIFDTFVAPARKKAAAERVARVKERVPRRERKQAGKAKSGA